MGAIDVFLIDYIFLRDWATEIYTRKHETLIKESCCRGRKFSSFWHFVFFEY